MLNLDSQAPHTGISILRAASAGFSPAAAPQPTAAKADVACYAVHTTDATHVRAHTFIMPTTDSPRIVSAERLDDGLVIKFSDQQCAFYSAALLYSRLPEAVLLDDTATQW